jgi:hypothetical protein
MVPTALVKGDRFSAAISAAKSGLTRQFTDKDGKPLSEFHKNALISANIMPDDQGRFVATSAAAVGTPTPAPSLVTRPTPAATPAASIRPAGITLTPEQESVVAKAESAIARGASVTAVRARLKEQKIPGF